MAEFLDEQWYDYFGRLWDSSRRLAKNGNYSEMKTDAYISLGASVILSRIVMYRCTTMSSGTSCGTEFYEQKHNLKIYAELKGISMPPTAYTLTTPILNEVAYISEQIGRITAQTQQQDLRLRRINRIRTIYRFTCTIEETLWASTKSQQF